MSALQRQCLGGAPIARADLAHDLGTHAAGVIDLDGGPFLEQYVTPPELTSFGISYTETGGVVHADYVRALILAVRPGMRSWQWQFVSPTGPYGSGSQLWPQIPSDVYPYNRQAGDVWTVPE